MKELGRVDPRRAQVVELRFFGGLNNEEIAEVLGVHSNTVVRDWNLARAWLKTQLR
jgi:RNA polymerase sigma factor (sigma-70 family)